MKVLIAFAIVVGGFCLPPPAEAAGKPLYVTREGLECVLANASDYLGSADDPIHLSMKACLRDLATGGGLISGFGMADKGESGNPWGSAVGVDRLPQAAGGASRSAQDSNMIVATDRLVLTKDQFRCLVAQAPNLPIVKDAFGNDVLRIDDLACKKTS